MSLNAYRAVCYTDDGCTLYQCLNCYNSWESRTEPGWFDGEGKYHVDWRFCPYCGTEWEGQHRCRRKYMPRWDWDRYGDEGIPYTPPTQESRDAERRARENEKCWVIQKKVTWNDDGLVRWYTHRVLPMSGTDHKTVFGWLKYYREQSEDGSGITEEYKAHVMRRRDIR